jgi:hypothetical protein
MDSTQILLQGLPISNEFRCDLGDERRTNRVKAVAESLAERPAESLPEVFDNPSDLEAVYRLLRNRSVGFKELTEGHLHATVERVDKVGRVCVLHDTTEFNWSHRDSLRWGLGKFSSRRQGFLAHVSLVVSADGLRCPLGCSCVRPYVRPTDLASEDEREWWSERHPYWDSEFDRWIEGVKTAQETMGDVAQLIHIMDREGDAYELMHLLCSQKWSFVIRFGRLRCVYDPLRGEYSKLHRVLENSPFVAERTVVISERINAGRDPYQRKAFPSRKGREVRVSIRACKLEICRPKKRSDLATLSKRIPVNVVEVVELDPPNGEEPVHWLLVTTEPINTVEEMLQVVDLYRSRWVIEEFFKAIKTGCGYRKRQLESAQTLLTALAITLPIAWRLLALRHLERCAADEPVGSVVSDIQLEILRRCAKACSISETPTLGETLYAVARLGGHLRSNGPPGWQVLGRGWMKLTLLEAGYRIAMKIQKEYTGLPNL